MPTFADKVIAFNRNLYYSGEMPKGFQALNPYVYNPETIEKIKAEYMKIYYDYIRRKFTIGINAILYRSVITGVPITDTKRLEHICGIKMHSAHTHEISSVYLYDMIQEFGGPAVFYKQFYINSPFPLAIIRDKGNGNWVNANYYDDRKLFDMVKDFMIESLQKHFSLGLDNEKVYILGKKNAVFLQKI